MINFLKNIIYPDVCGICGNINKNAICKKCEKALKKYEIKNIENYQMDKSKDFDYLINMYKYEGIIRDKIIEYKFGEKSYLYKTFARLIIKNKKICSFLKTYDIIIPTPMYKTRKWQRGYNQTELIAREVANELNIELDKKHFKKIKDNNRQSTLTKLERTENVKNVFKVIDIEKISDKRIILFDDIYTTGSTANECAKVLKKAGAQEIVVLTVAKD